MRPSLKTNGLEAIAIACAAFCIPTSMTIVRRTFSFRRNTMQATYATMAARRMRAVVTRPRVVKFSSMVARCWMKNTAARNIRAGKAHLVNTRSIFFATLWKYVLTAIPASIGISIVNTFWMRRLPTGNVMPADCPTCTVTQLRIRGTVKSVITELSAVSETDNATSPFASMENTLLDDPPGEHATRTSPM